MDLTKSADTDSFSRYDRVTLQDKKANQEWQGLFRGRTQDNFFIYLPAFDYEVIVPVSQIEEVIREEPLTKSDRDIAKEEVLADKFLASLESSKKNSKSNFAFCFYKYRRYVLTTSQGEAYDCVYLMKSAGNYYFFLLADLPHPDELGKTVVRPGLTYKLKSGDSFVLSNEPQAISISYMGWLNIYFEIKPD